jgi:hypothetical protein
MRFMELPDLDLLRQLPERGPLLLVLAALDLADASLRIEHPRLDIEPLPPRPGPPPTELLAELLLARFAELRTLVLRYNAAADDALGREEDEELPF